MSNFKRAVSNGVPRSSLPSSLRAVQMQDTKAILPAEIISTILDFLPVPDLIRFGRTSRRMQEMVYDDTRWVQRLRSLGCWNEAQARARFEDAMKRKWEAQQARQLEETRKAAGVGTSVLGTRQTSTTLFDAGQEEERRQKAAEAANKPIIQGAIDGFETLSLSKAPPPHLMTASRPATDPQSALNVLSEVRSIRGSARQEYGRVYAALAPFYFDLARSKSHTDPVIFRAYRDPEQQAKMLSQLQIFSKSDWAQGWSQREDKLTSMIGIFENAVLREFEQGYEAGDIDGRMHRYAHVLDLLNGGAAGVDLFVQKAPLFSERARLGHAMDCLNQASAGAIVLEPSRYFFEKLSLAFNEQTAIIDRVFPHPSVVQRLFLERIVEDVIGEYVSPLFDEAHERSIASYLKAVSGIFEQSRRFAVSLTPVKDAGEAFLYDADIAIAKAFEPHVDLYLQEELDFFKRTAENQVSSWEKKLSADDASTESFFMANVNRQADKKDFLSSFKKVVMMPVNALPSMPMSSPFNMTKASSSSTLQVTNGSANSESTSPMPSRPHSPSMIYRSASPGVMEAPTDELAAKASLMASRLEGIKSLFSIEIALTLVHSAQASLERAEHFVKLGGQAGEESKEQCEQIFVALLQILGSRHVKNGFDKAVEHLSKYNPREVSEHTQNGVAPLVTFLELVNVGDLISQMIDVFFEQQLAATKLTDKNDFLDPAVQAKKKFEQMLDERVAAGLNKGIDVLMDEVEYICATTQLTADYNPPPALPGKAQDFDIGPTKCAQQVVNLVSSHTKMLTGSTDKSMLDVFNQEVGLRLFAAICKHLKRQRVSTFGAIKLISDMNIYFLYIQTLKNTDLLQYFKALRELSQIYLIDPQHAKDMATIIADGDRFGGIFRAEEVYEFAERRSDWYQVKSSVERAMYGFGCLVM